jgi:hypothetical protein
MKLFLPGLLLLASCFIFPKSHAQVYRIKGTVYDSSHLNPLEAVSVLCTCGTGTVTNSEGNYEITVGEKDSIWFSYLNKPTVKFPVLKIYNTLAFDISLKVSVTVLKEVKIRPRNYKQDSMQNRLDYAKGFNYQKPKIRGLTPEYGQGAGFDLDNIIQMFHFRQNRSMLAFQRRLVEEEHDKFIDHRFNKALVRRLTLADSASLEKFMLLYRPSFAFTQWANDYDFQEYIKTAYSNFLNGIGPAPFYKQEEQQ